MDWTRLAKIAAHGVTGGTVSELQGGEFGSGFFGGAFAQIGAPYLKGLSEGYHRVIASAVIGGTAAEIGGGKFANGAVAGGFSGAIEEIMRSGSTRDLTGME